MLGATPFSDEEIQVIMHFPPTIRIPFLRGIAAMGVSTPTRPLQDTGPLPSVSQQGANVDMVPGESRTIIHHVGDTSDTGAPSSPPPATPLRTRSGCRPLKRRRVDSTPSPVPSPNRHQVEEASDSEPAMPPAPTCLPGPCRRCFVKSLPCIPIGKSSIRCRGCKDKHRKCEARRPDDVPEVERLQTPSPTLTTAPLSTKPTPISGVDQSPDLYQTDVQLQHTPVDPAGQQVATALSTKNLESLDLLRSEVADAFAQQRKMNEMFLQEMTVIEKRTRPPRVKEESATDNHNLAQKPQASYARKSI